MARSGDAGWPGAGQGVPGGPVGVRGGGGDAAEETKAEAKEEEKEEEEEDEDMGFSLFD